jgi:hypothetical protein
MLSHLLSLGCLVLEVRSVSFRSCLANKFVNFESRHVERNTLMCLKVVRLWAGTASCLTQQKKRIRGVDSDHVCGLYNVFNRVCKIKNA